MARVRSRTIETETVNPRLLGRGSVKRQHIGQWAVGRDELAPGVVGDTHLHPEAIERIRELAGELDAAGSGRYVRVGTAAHAGAGDVALASTVTSYGWDDPATFPVTAYYDVHVAAEIDGSPDPAASWQFSVGGAAVMSGPIRCGGLLVGVLPTLEVLAGDAWSLAVEGADLLAGEITVQLVERKVADPAPEPPSVTQACGEIYTGGVNNLSLVDCDIQAGDLLLIAAAHTWSTSGGLDVTTPGVTQLYKVESNIGSNRKALHGVWSLVADAGTKAAGIDYTLGGTASGNGRIDVFVFRGWSLDAFVASGIPAGAANLGALTDGNFVIGLSSPSAPGSVGPATIAGQTSIGGDERHRLFTWDGSALTVDGSGIQTAIGLRLL